MPSRGKPTLVRSDSTHHGVQRTRLHTRRASATPLAPTAHGAAALGTHSLGIEGLLRRKVHPDGGGPMGPSGHTRHVGACRGMCRQERASGGNKRAHGGMSGWGHCLDLLGQVGACRAKWGHVGASGACGGMWGHMGHAGTRADKRGQGWGRGSRADKAGLARPRRDLTLGLRHIQKFPIEPLFVSNFWATPLSDFGHICPPPPGRPFVRPPHTHTHIRGREVDRARERLWLCKAPCGRDAVSPLSAQSMRKSPQLFTMPSPMAPWPMTAPRRTADKVVYLCVEQRL